MNQIYGFEGEVKAKYTAQMYELFSEVFEWLPLAQCINGKVLVRAAGGGRRAGEGRGAPFLTETHHSPRSCMEACSVRMVSPWMISGRLSGIGSRQTQVSGPRAQRSAWAHTDFVPLASTGPTFPSASWMRGTVPAGGHP